MSVFLLGILLYTAFFSCSVTSVEGGLWYELRSSQSSLGHCGLL